MRRLGWTFESKERRLRLHRHHYEHVQPMAMLNAIAGKTPQAVAEALYKYIYLDLAGFPMILRSDNGLDFTAELTRELNRLIGTEQVFSAPYHPRSFGIREGSHKPM